MHAPAPVDQGNRLRNRRVVRPVDRPERNRGLGVALCDRLQASEAVLAHFKESPFACLEEGLWPQLVDLLTRSDRSIYSSREMRKRCEAAVPAGVDRPPLVLDSDLPKRERFDGGRSRAR